jgi:uncharacterized membrane protein
MPAAIRREPRFDPYAGTLVIMSTTLFVISFVAQLLLAYMLFMLAVFAGGASANGLKLRREQLRNLDLSIYLLPLLSLFAAGFLALHFFLFVRSLNLLVAFLAIFWCCNLHAFIAPDQK